MGPRASRSAVSQTDGPAMNQPNVTHCNAPKADWQESVPVGLAAGIGVSQPCLTMPEISVDHYHPRQGTYRPTIPKHDGASYLAPPTRESCSTASLEGTYLRVSFQVRGEAACVVSDSVVAGRRSPPGPRVFLILLVVRHRECPCRGAMMCLKCLLVDSYSSDGIATRATYAG